MESAVAYIRVSSQRQVEGGASLDSQTEQVESYAKAQGFELTRIFREEGESAKTDQRPKLQEMLRFCRDRKARVQVVIVPKIDRLARNVNDYANLKIQLSRLGIRLESLGERIEDTPAGRFTETILASVAQFDNEIRAERSKGGMETAVTQGRWVWKAPLGYRNVRVDGRGTIEPDPVEAPLVREVFRLLADGHQSARTVRDYLNSQGVRIGLPGFYKLIRNEIYIGHIRAFGKVHQAAPPFTAIVDNLTFRSAQKAFKPTNHPQQYQRESNDFPLRGSALCQCGKRFTASWSRGEQGKRYGYYRCMNCGYRAYPRKRVDAAFEAELGTYEGNEAGWQRLKTLLLHYQETTIKVDEADRNSILSRIQKLEDLRDAVILKNASGVVPDDLAMRQINRLGEEIAELAAEIPAWRAADVEGLIAFARSYFNDLRSTWNSFSLKTKKDLLRFMFPEGILFDPECGFRTPAKSLPERFKRVVLDDVSTLVDPGSEFSNSLHEWLASLKALQDQSDQRE